MDYNIETTDHEKTYLGNEAPYMRVLQIGDLAGREAADLRADADIIAAAALATIHPVCSVRIEADFLILGLRAAIPSGVVRVFGQRVSRDCRALRPYRLCRRRRPGRHDLLRSRKRQYFDRHLATRPVTEDSYIRVFANVPVG